MDSNCAVNLLSRRSSIPSRVAITLLSDYVIFRVDYALLEIRKRFSMVSGSLSNTFSAISGLNPFAMRFTNILGGMSSSQASCWILEMYSSSVSSICCLMSSTSMSKLFLVFPNLTRNASFRFTRVLLDRGGKAKYHCCAISLR